MSDKKQYTGTKTVTAWPAERQEGEAGYAIEYADGYRSWSPKDVFEATYKPSGTWQERLLIEYDELKARTEKLGAFIVGLRADDTRADALEAQYGIMLTLLAVLKIRLADAGYAVGTN